LQALTGKLRQSEARTEIAEMAAKNRDLEIQRFETERLEFLESIQHKSDRRRAVRHEAVIPGTEVVLPDPTEAVITDPAVIRDTENCLNINISVYANPTNRKFVANRNRTHSIDHAVVQNNYGHILENARANERYRTDQSTQRVVSQSLVHRLDNFLSQPPTGTDNLNVLTS